MLYGSKWRKWDLHVHTPESFEHSYKLSKAEKTKFDNDPLEKLIDIFEKQDDFAAIGITDYFSIDGYKKVSDYQKKGRLKNIEIVFPNIEFRLDVFVNSKRLNYHVIFSPEVEAEKIEHEFLEELHIKTPDVEPRKLSKQNIIEIGSVLKEHHKPFRNKPDYWVGCANITVSFDEILQVLREKKSLFGGKYLLVLAAESWDSIDWDSQDHLTRKSLLTPSHAIFSSNPNTIEWSLGKKHPTPADFIAEFSSLKPCLHGSDAHSFDKVFKPDEERYCWIKSDPTFEGLKQVVFEPEERVRIQTPNPEARKSIYTLSSFGVSNSLISDDLAINEQVFPLNRCLIAVTGGKGTGKTALLDLVANCFEDRCKRSGVDSNSFVQRIEDQKDNLAVKISFLGTDIKPFSKELIEERFFQDSRITYLPQGKIEDYSGDRKKLDTKIEEIIFANKEVVEGNYRERFDVLKSEILTLQSDIRTINNLIFDLEEETRAEILKELQDEIQIKDGEVADKEDEIKSLVKSMKEDIKEVIENLRKDETDNRTKHSLLDELKTNLRSFKTQLNERVEVSNNEITQLNRKLKSLKIGKQIPAIDVKPQLGVIQESLKLIPSQVKEIKKVLDEIQSKLRKLTGVEKQHADLISERDAIVSTRRILKSKLTRLKNKRDKISDYAQNRDKQYLEFLFKYWEWKDYYDEVIKVFSSGKSKIMDGLAFESTIHFDLSKFEELGSDILDLRRINFEDIQHFAQEILNFTTSNKSQITDKNLTKLHDRLSKVKNCIRTTRNASDFYGWIYGNYFTLSTSVLYQGTSMNKLSMGQKGIALLKLFLAEGDNPLVIDQPEENLDNKFIYEELVGAFREAKKNRQIILATNNANLVVNTDTDQIIVANFSDNLISYSMGSIENPGIRKEIMPILEGGVEAFRKREMKYGL